MAQTIPRTIEYHHDIKDKVFFMKDNKVIEGEINGLTAYLFTERGTKKTKIEYSVLYKNQTNGNTISTNLKEEMLFESKSKLLDSL